ncbi:ABC transporter substrate-binding protein [Nesterenkonia sp. CF4.4]|uniref:ABC transporter substrate-binding protein n=1 Tax=Nesterenkonia sp. CF4.4 TaxID=3373079 RepID=UPI003EE4E741
MLSSCGGEGDSAEGSEEGGGTLSLGSVTPLSSFEPWQASWAQQSVYLQPVYDTLLRADPEGEIVEGLATDWEWDESRTELTLTLRDGVTFSDGSELTAEVAAESLERFRDGTSENSSFLAGISEVEATDDLTLVVTLEEPDPTLLVYLTQNAGLVGAESMWDAEDAQTNPVGTGPYELDAGATVVGSTYVYTARDDYWDPESVHYDEIRISLYGDATSLMNAVQGGQVDATATQTPTQIPEAEAAGFTANTVEINWAGFLLVDRDGEVNPALEDVRVRQAINHALDRESLVEAIADGYGTPTTQIIGPDSGAYDAELDERYPHDTELAMELLAEAGYEDGFTLTMPSNDFVPESEFAIYAEQLGTVGIDVEWETTGDDLFGQMLGGTWAAFPFQLQADPTAWQTAQLSVLPGATWNPFGTEDEEVATLAEQMRTSELEESEQFGQELNEYLVEEAWFAPVYRPEAAFLTNDETQVELQVGNVYPYLWNIKPAS